MNANNKEDKKEIEVKSESSEQKPLTELQPIGKKTVQEKKVEVVKERKKKEVKEEEKQTEQKPDRDLEWYERLGLEKDPFDHRNLSPRVLGHNKEKRQLIEWIKEGRSVLLYGPTGVGKTNMITELISEVKENKIEGLKKFGIMSHSFDTPYKPNHVKSYKKAKGFFGLGRRKVVAFMDEIHFGEDKDVLSVSAMWDKKDIHSAIFVQIHPKPKLDQLVRRIGIYKLQLAQVNKNVIMDIIKQRTEDKQIFESDALEAVIKLGGDNPSIVLQLCGEIASYIADPKKPISLKDIKDFKFSDIQGMSKQALRSIKLPDTLDEKARKKAGCSPYEWEIVKNLRTGEMTLNDLAKELDKKSSQVGSVLNRMKKKDVVEIKNTGRPKLYGLIDKFEREYVLSNG